MFFFIPVIFRLQYIILPNFFLMITIKLSDFTEVTVVFSDELERVVGEGERMMEVLQQWGQQRGEVRYLLHHQRAPGRESCKKCTQG